MTQTGFIKIDIHMLKLFFTNRVNVTPWSVAKGIKRIFKNRFHPITLQ